MHNPPELNTGSSPDIPQPLYSQPDAFVENVYPHPLSVEMPDTTSQEVVSNYLIARMNNQEPKERVQVVLTPSARTLPIIVRESVGTKDAHRLERTDEWLIRPRTAVAVWASSLALFNASPIVGDVQDEVAQATHRVVSVLGLGPEGRYEDVIKRVPTVETPIIIKRHVSAANQPGSAETSATELEAFRAAVDAAAKPSAEVAVTVTALSSDEYGTDASLGVKEAPDQDMSDERKAAWSQAVAEALPDAQVQARAHQAVLTKRQVKKLSRLAERAGFEGDSPMVSAVRAAELGAGTPELRKFVAKHFKRGVDLTASIQNPDITTMVEVPEQKFVPAVNEAPDDPNRDYKPFFIPLPWLRKRRWVNVGEREVKRWRIRPGKQILRPQVLRETLDQAWLRVRPEAMTDQNTLKDDSWAYTQKYEHLLRDGRIAEVLRADITDGDKQSSLRIFFVDKKPEPETRDAFTKLLQSFAAMKTPDGQTIADTVTGMFVMPSENTGRHGRNPKKIGLGIDQQYDESVSGVMYYPLRLVELHLPASLQGAELQAYLNDYRGAVWTLAHEAAGHGTDVAKEPMTLRRVYSRHIQNAHVFEGNPRAGRMQALADKLPPLWDTSQTDGVRQFDITYPVPDKDGNIFMMSARVDEHDPRLQHAHSATIVGHEHTMYAGEDDSEHYAEVAGAATGITTDYSEANIKVDTVSQNGVTGNFATGYHPDATAQALYAESVGAISGTMPLAFENPPKVIVVSGAPEDDPLLRQHMIRARRSEMLKPKDLLAILTPTSRRRA